MKHLKNLYRSTVAGILIGMACVISAHYENPELVFPVGIFCVILSGALLYTGIIGQSSIKHWRLVCTTLIGNFIGVSLVTLYAKFFIDYKVFAEAVLYKVSIGYLPWFISSIFCGLLMCAATSLRIENSFFTTFLCVAAFIVVRFEHSIADTFYLLLDGLQMDDIIRLVIAVVGNALGAKLLWWTHLIKNKQSCRRQFL